MKIFIFLAVLMCAYADEVKETPTEKAVEPEPAKEQSKRQAQEGFVPSQFIYASRPPRKQEQVAPVEESQEEEKETLSRADNEEYRPGQVFSLNPQELLELQPERKAPLPSSQQLQQLYNNPQPDPRQNLQQIYFLEPQAARQVGQVPEGLVQVTSPAQNILHPNNAKLHQMHSSAQPSTNSSHDLSQVPQLNATENPDPIPLRVLHQLQADVRQHLHQLYYIKPKNGAVVADRLEGLFEIVPALSPNPVGSTPPPTPETPLDTEPTTVTSQDLVEITPPPRKPSTSQVTQQEQPSNSTQVSLQPSHAVIARPHYSSNGGEASVGAALSVSDSGVGATDSFDQELLALLGQAPVRQQESPQAYQQVQASTQSIAPQYQQISTQSVAPQYQQVDRYITKPNKKPSKHRPKVHSLVSPPQSSAAPQQYLIETTNVQQQQPQQQPQQVQYRPAPQQQPRPTQALRYVPIPTAQAFLQQALYERPEAQGLKVVAAPNLQQARPALAYRIVPQYQQQEASPKQYRIVEAPRQQTVQQRIPASSIERPVTFLKRFPEPEKMRAIKIYDPVPQEALAPQQPTQIIGEQYYLRPYYRPNEQRGRYELTPLGIRTVDQPRAVESTKPPHSSIYVSQKLSQQKIARPQSARSEQTVKIDKSREQSLRRDQPSSVEQVNIEQHGQNLEEQRSQLPPPRNNRAYTPEEFAALVAAGYAVTPIPVAPLGAVAQSRASVEPAPSAQRRPLYSRRNPYLPLRADDAP